MPALNWRRGLRVIEAHSGLSAHLASAISVPDRDGAFPLAFDALWVSSLTASALQCLPDAELYLLDRRFDIITDVVSASSKPVIVDGDTGGDELAVTYLVERLERIGVAALCIEDKVGPKRNSFARLPQSIDSPEGFSRKLAAAARARSGGNLRIIARLEGLICGHSLSDTLDRAHLYATAGADAILVHCKRSYEDLTEFASEFRSGSADRPPHPDTPLVCIPTAFPSIADDYWFMSGFDMVIYANHVMRASMKAIEAVCESILVNHGCSKCDDLMGNFHRILKLSIEEHFARVARAALADEATVALTTGE